MLEKDEKAALVTLNQQLTSIKWLTSAKIVTDGIITYIDREMGKLREAKDLLEEDKRNLTKEKLAFKESKKIEMIKQELSGLIALPETDHSCLRIAAKFAILSRASTISAGIVQGRVHR